MNIVFRNDIASNQMVIENVKEFSPGAYAVRILKENRVNGLLAFDYETVNGKTDVLYDVSAKDPFLKEYEVLQMGFDDIRRLLFSLQGLLGNINGYLLDPDNIVLKKECIFIDRSTRQFEYCYFPYYGGNLILELRELFSQILSMLDYDDRKAVRLAYDIQKKTQSENFTFDELLKTAQMIGAEPEIVPDEKDETFLSAGERSPGKTPSESRQTAPYESTFFQKAGLYFKETEAGDIFDDFNELKIFKKIRNYGNESPKEGLKMRAGAYRNKKRRQRKEEPDLTDPAQDLPPEMRKLQEEMMV